MNKSNNLKAWIYLVPAFLFIAVFMIYPLIDVFVYSFENGFDFVTRTYDGVGLFNFKYVLRDPEFLQAVKNTFLIVLITVPASTILALMISIGLSSIKRLRKLYQTIYFLPYVTNTLAVGLVFMILFKKTEHTVGLVNIILNIINIGPIDFINGPYIAKLFVMCFYIIWTVLPFKILILTSALASVNDVLYDAARIDQTPKRRVFTKITIPMILPTLFYLIITGFIGAFKVYSDAVALFGTDLNSAGMNTIVGYIYYQLYDFDGGYPSFASAAAIILFFIVLSITIINLFIKKKKGYEIGE